MSDDHSDLSQALAISTARKIAAIVEENDNGSGDIEACWLDIEKEIFSAIAKERARCAKICADAAEEYKQMARTCRRQDRSAEHAWLAAADCLLEQARAIRGEQ